jgi:hypothetical protein
MSLYVEIFHSWIEYEQRVVIRFLLQEDANMDNIHRRLQAQFTDNGYSIGSVRRWCQFIRQGREDIHDDPRSGHPPTDLVDTKILSTLKRRPFHSAYSLVEILSVSYSTILCHLLDSLGMENFHLRWVPHELTPNLHRRPSEIYGRLLPTLKQREPDSFQMFVIRDGR